LVKLKSLGKRWGGQGPIQSGGEEYKKNVPG